MEEKFSIAIDGPAGAGKSTIAKKVARTLGFVYVDTGAMYRAMALYMLRQGYTAAEARRDPQAYEAKASAACQDAKISIEYRDGEQVVLLNGENVNSLIRTEEVSEMASVTSAIPAVRTKLVELQQELAMAQDVVMDGRDIGTVVLPKAQVKVYLTASVEVRAKRRYIENVQKQKAGKDVPAADLDPDKISREIADRDYRDMHREISPLKQAEDAALVDSSDMTIDEVAETILNLYASKKGRPQVITAKTAGFCFGVQKAVDAVYGEALRAARDSSAGPINTFGPIIHNEEVVRDLQDKGVGVIETEEEIDAQQGGTIVIRSHGVPKRLYDKISGSGAKCVDTTCTFVKRIHEIVQKESLAGKKIIIIGNHGHAEVEGTKGWSVTPAAVIETAEEARALSLDPGTPVCVVAQTTFNGEKFEELVAILQKKSYNVSMNNTICNATRERQSEAREIARRADIMIVIGGKSSSNTAKLYEICKKECNRTCFIQTAADLDLKLDGSERLIGITAGASTPNKIIEEVQKDVRRTDF